jgi:hypothetical protein
LDDFDCVKKFVRIMHRRVDRKLDKPTGSKVTVHGIAMKFILWVLLWEHCG